MRCFKSVLIILALLIHAGCSNSYQRLGADQFTGYKDKQLSANIWEVKGHAFSKAYRGAALDVAVYRAAEIGLARDFRFMQLLNARNTATNGQFQLGGTNDAKEVVIKVRYIRNTGKGYSFPEEYCELEHPLVCQTISSEGKLRSIGSKLKVSR